jgi:hypothetical protein
MKENVITASAISKINALEHSSSNVKHVAPDKTVVTRRL